MNTSYTEKDAFYNCFLSKILLILAKKKCRYLWRENSKLFWGENVKLFRRENLKLFQRENLKLFRREGFYVYLWEMRGVDDPAGGPCGGLVPVADVDVVDHVLEEGRVHRVAEEEGEVGGIVAPIHAVVHPPRVQLELNNKETQINRSVNTDVFYKSTTVC